VDENHLWHGIIESLRVDQRPKASQVCVYNQLIMIHQSNMILIHPFTAFLDKNKMVLGFRNSRGLKIRFQILLPGWPRAGGVRSN
jgi:hypothetical protein